MKPTLQALRKAKGSWVVVTFLDHAQGIERVCNSPIRAMASGRLVFVDAQYIVLRYWETLDTEDDAQDNNETLVIVRSAIIDITK